MRHWMAISLALALGAAPWAGCGKSEPPRAVSAAAEHHEDEAEHHEAEEGHVDLSPAVLR
mgnify:FL=1